jgi:flagella basal body P-ring formation protein FlgA
MFRANRIRGWLFAQAVIAASPVAQADVLIAARPIARGAVIVPTDVARTASHVLLLGALIDPEQAVGHVARHAIAPGVPLRADALEFPVLVHRGDPVMLRIVRPGFTVEARGQAAANGSKGDAVAATNSSTGARLRGAVRDAGIILIDALNPPAPGP